MIDHDGDLTDVEPERIHVLHVDDEQQLAETAAAFLEREDDRFDVAVAPSPERGLEHLAEADVDCVVSDYDMPEADGLTFLEQVREDHPRLPFILFTGKGSEEVASEAISAGVTDYLQKGHGDELYAMLANRIAHAVEAHRARRAVERSERRLRRTYERITDALFTVDADWHYTFVNEEGARIVGKDPAEMVGERVWDVFPELEESPFGDLLRSAMETGETASLEAEYGPHDTWYDVRVYPDEAGISIFFQDVADRKQREREVVRERDRYATLFENAATPIMGFHFEDGSPVVEAVNESFEEVFDYREEEVVGRPVAETIVPDEEEGHHASIADRVRAGERVEEEVRRETADGLRDFVLRVIPVDIADASTDGYAWLSDITERKRHARELAETNALLESILDTTPAAVFVKDAEGRYQLMNDECRALFGLEDADVEGLTDHDIFPEEVAEGFRADDRRVLERGATVETEERVPTEDGDRTFLTLKSPLAGDDGASGVCSVSIDITERVAYEHEVEEKDRRLDELASVISHDLRNPIQVLDGALDLAAETGEAEHFDRAQRAVDRMRRLVDDLLTLADEGRTLGERTSVDLAKLVESCWSNVETAGADLELATELAVRADAGRLAQLFENLFDNAVTHGGDDVTVTVGDLDDGTGFYVEDTGVGIPDGERDAVFDSGHTTEDRGTGLGLAIVDQIVEAHGWHIVATEADGGGARFEVRDVDVA